ncbi:hypothetical protein [Nocardia sp. NPDC057030]
MLIGTGRALSNVRRRLEIEFEALRVLLRSTSTRIRTGSRVESRSEST